MRYIARGFIVGNRYRLACAYIFIVTLISSMFVAGFQTNIGMDKKVSSGGIVKDDDTHFTPYGHPKLIRSKSRDIRAIGKLLEKSRYRIEIREHDGPNSAVRCEWLYYTIEYYDGTLIADPASGNGKIYGKVTVYDRYSIGNKYRTVGGLFLNAYDIDGQQPYNFPYINPSDTGGSTSDWDRLGWTTTSPSGIFELEFGNTDGLWGAYGTQDVFIHFFTNISGEVIIENTSGYVYQYRMWDDIPDVPSGDAVTIWVNGTEVDTNVYANDRTLDGNQWRYSNDQNKIITYILSGPLADIYVVTKLAHDFMVNTVSIDPPEVYVYYPTSASNAYYNPNDGRIYVPQGDTINYTELFMAYGQFLLDKYADLAPPYFEADYSFESHKNTTTAWVNGWSLFFAEAVKKYWNNYYIYNGSFSRKDLESVYDSDGEKNDEDVIRAVAGILWDIMDSNNDDQDNDTIGDSLNYGFSEIWNVITKYKPWDVFEFANSFIQEYSVNSTKMWELCWENGVNLDDVPPTQPNITSYLPDINVWKNQSWIWMEWVSCYDQNQMSLLAGYKILVKDKNNITKKTILLNKAQLEVNLTLGSGTWQIYLIAYDRAGNENVTTLGYFQLDTRLPSYYRVYPYDGDVIYDNESGSIVLMIDWFDTPSGVNATYIRYKFGENGTWSNWFLAQFDGIRFYELEISENVWKDPNVWGNNSQIVLYWESKCIDNASNLAFSEIFEVILVDDDSTPPTVLYPDTSLVIYDNSSDDYVVWVEIEDFSEIYNVTFEIWFEDAVYLYDNDSIQSNGTKYYVVIPRAIWENYVRCKVYITIYAWDNDRDRVGDRKLKFVERREIGEIRDDDNDPPMILEVYSYEGPLGSDSLIETDEQLYLVIKVYDESGIKPMIIVDWGLEI